MEPEEHTTISSPTLVSVETSFQFIEDEEIVTEVYKLALKRKTLPLHV